MMSAGGKKKTRRRPLAGGWSVRGVEGSNGSKPFEFFEFRRDLAMLKRAWHCSRCSVICARSGVNRPTNF